MNTSSMLQMMGEIKRFNSEHPKVAGFFSYLKAKGLKEGAIMEFKYTDPNGEEKVCNFRLTDADISMIEKIVRK